MTENNPFANLPQAQEAPAPAVAARGVAPVEDDPFASLPDAKAEPAGMLANFGAGANDVIGAVLGAPTNIPNAIVEKVTGYKPKVRGLDQTFYDTLDVAGKTLGGRSADPRQVVPADDSEKIARVAGQGAPTAMLPAGAANVMRQGVTAATAAAKPIATGALDMMALGANKLGGLFNIGAGGAVAEAGGEAARQAAPEGWESAAQFGGTLGAGGLYGLAQAGGQALTNLGKRVIEPFTKAGRDRLVTENIKANSSKPDDLAYDLSQGKDEYVPGAVRSTAEVANDPKLMAHERGVGTENAAAFGERRGERAAAREATLQNVQADYRGGAIDTQDFIRKQLDDLRQSGDQAGKLAADEAEKRLAELGPGMTPETAGEVIRSVYDKHYGRAKAYTKSEYQAVDPQNTSRFAMGNVEKPVNDMMKEIYGKGGGSPKAEVDALVNDLRGLARKEVPIDPQNPEAGVKVVELQQPFAVLQRLYSRAVEMASDKVTYNARERAIAGKVASSIEDQMEGQVRARTAKMDHDQYDTYNAARDLRTEQGRLYEQGPSGKLGRNKAYGEEVVPDSQVAAQFFTKGDGGYSNTTKFVETFGDKQKAVDAGSKYLVGKLQGLIDDKRNIDPAHYKAFMDEYAGPLRALRSLPEGRVLWNKINTAQKAAQFARDTGEQAAKTVADYEKGVAGHFLKANPGDAIQTVLNSKNSDALMAELVAKTGKDKVAAQGVRRATAEHLVNEFTSNMAYGGTNAKAMKGNQFQNFLKDKQTTLRRAGFDDDQMGMLKALSDDIESANMVTAGAKTPYGSNTASDTATAQNLPQKARAAIHTLGHVMRTAAGGGAAGYVVGGPVTAIGGAAIAGVLGKATENNAKAMNALLVDAMLNPATARDLMTRVTPRNEADVAKNLAAHLTRLGFLSTNQRE